MLTCQAKLGTIHFSFAVLDNFPLQIHILPYQEDFRTESRESFVLKLLQTCW